MIQEEAVKGNVLTVDDVTKALRMHTIRRSLYGFMICGCGVWNSVGDGDPHEVHVARAIVSDTT